MYLFFDTETTGLPRRRNAPVEDVNNWPRIVQIAWAAYDENGRQDSAESHIIRPEGFIIPREAERVHGISTARAMNEGKPVVAVLERFTGAVGSSATIVAHNLKYDEPIILAEYIRLGKKSPFGMKPKICTMTGTTEICKIPGPYGFKWPTLEELHRFLFTLPPEASHDALADVETCAKCYFELKRRGEM
jgi:DNA polymerase III subunit epsilon